MQQRNLKTTRGKPRVASIQRNLFPRPPSFDSNFEFFKRIRFVTTAPITRSLITRGQALDVLSVATTTTSLYRLLGSVRISRVEIWAPPGVPDTDSAYTSNAISVEWLSSYAKSKTRSDSSMSIEPSHLVFKAPRMTLAGEWSLSGSNESENLLALTAPSSAIIDIDFHMILQKSETPTVLLPFGTGFVVGQIYVLTYNTSIVPVDYPTAVI